MSNVIVSPNMNLPVPVPGVDPGPDYANNINSSLNIVDGHNHTPGSGVAITPAGLNINSDLSVQSNKVTNVEGVQYSAPASSALLTYLYTNLQSGGGVTDLFYNDGAGNVIPITKGGVVNATVASIPGESYAGGTFTWVQGAGSTTPANFDIGSVTIRPNSEGTAYGVILNPPAAISSEYDLQLPTIPSTTSFVTLDSSGNLSTVSGVSPAQIANESITGSQIANGTITGTQIANATIEASNLDTGAISASQILRFTANGSWVAPANVNAVYIDMWGGGGGGGGGSGSGFGGGGAGGGRQQGWVAVSPGTTYGIVVGTGGGGTQFDGGSGTQSTFSNASNILFSAPGGPGGLRSAFGGAGGGVTFLGILSAAGGAGQNPGQATYYGPGGVSGASYGGGGGGGWLANANGGQGGNPFSGNNGNIANSGSGGGGGGASSSPTSGGNGQDGMVTLYWSGFP